MKQNLRLRDLYCPKQIQTDYQLYPKKALDKRNTYAGCSRTCPAFLRTFFPLSPAIRYESTVAYPGRIYQNIRYTLDTGYIGHSRWPNKIRRKPNKGISALGNAQPSSCFSPPSLTLPSGPIPICPAYTSVKRPKSDTLAKGKRLYSGRKAHSEKQGMGHGQGWNDLGGGLGVASELGANSVRTRIALLVARAERVCMEYTWSAHGVQKELRRAPQEIPVKGGGPKPRRQFTTAWNWFGKGKSMVRALLGCASARSRSVAEGLSKGSRTIVEALSKDCRTSLEQQSNNGRRTIEESCVCTHAKAPARSGLGLALGLTLFLILWMSIGAYAQTNVQRGMSLDSVRPLQIGDTIPDVLWNQPLQVVNHPEGKETITLNDYRGKLIILDFWATWCAVCIANIPTMLEYQKKFGDEVAIVHVSPQSKSMILPFLEKRKDWLHALSAPFYSALDTGRYLFRAFPSEGLPNLGVIDGKGKVVGQVRPRYISERTIAKLLEEVEHAYLPTTRSESYVKNKPLLRFAYDDIKHFQPIYYSTLMGIVEGWAMWGGTETDTLNKTKRRYSLNSDLLSLYRLALDEDIQALGTTAADVRDFIYRPHMRILEVDSPDHYKFRFDRAWMRRHIYSYEALLPLDASEASFQQRLRYDLDNLLGLEGRIEKRSLECLVLRNIGNGVLPYQTQKEGSKLMVRKGFRVTARESRRDSIGAFHGKTTYARITMKGFVNEVLERLDEFYNIKYTKQNLPLPAIIDETGYDGHVSVYLPDQYPTIATLRETLREQGLDLTKETREMHVFVLTQHGYHIKPDQRYRISPYGYLPAEHDFFQYPFD